MNVKFKEIFPFLILFAIYVFFSRGGYDGYELENYLTAENIFLRQELNLALGYSNLPGVPDTNGKDKVFVRHGIAQPLLEAPFYALGYGLSQFIYLPAPAINTSISNISKLNMVRLGVVSLFNPMMTVLTAFLIYQLLRNVLGIRKEALCLSLIFGLATPAFPYAVLGLEPLLGFGLFGVFYFSMRAYQEERFESLLVASLFSLILVNSKSYAGALAIPLAFFAAGILFINRRRFLPFIPKLTIVSLLWIAAYLIFFAFNLYKSGSFFSSASQGYGSALNFSHFIQNSIGYFLSTGKGLFFYSPILFLSLWGIKSSSKQLKLGFWVIIAIFAIWFLTILPLGFLLPDEMWGPRYLVALIPFLMIPLAFTFQGLSSYLRGRILLTLLIVASFLTQLPGVLYWGPDLLKASFAAGASTIEQTTFVPGYSPLTIGLNVLKAQLSSALFGPKKAYYSVGQTPGWSSSGAITASLPPINLLNYSKIVILPARLLSGK